jgi:hypothetical protein
MKYGFSPVLLLSAFMIGPQSHAPSKVLLAKGMTLNLYDNLVFVLVSESVALAYKPSCDNSKLFWPLSFPFNFLLVLEILCRKLNK